MGIPDRLAGLLEKNRVHFEILQHREAFTAQELAAIEHVKGKQHAKVVIVKADGERLMTVVPADHRVDLEKLSKMTGKRLELAAEEEFAPLFPDCAKGAMPPFGSLYNLPTYVDRSLTRAEHIVFEAGTHTDAVKMRYADYERLAKPIVGDFAAKLH